MADKFTIFVGEMRFSVDNNKPITLTELLQCNEESIDAEDFKSIVCLNVGEKIYLGMNTEILRTV